MNRKYTREWYLERVAAIRRIIPDCGLSTKYFAEQTKNRPKDHHIDPYDKPAEQKIVEQHANHDAAYGKSPHHAVIFPIQHHKNHSSTAEPVKKILHTDPEIPVWHDSAKYPENII